MNPVSHALVLNLHQPSGNLEDLLAHNHWEASEILFALDRIPRALWPFAVIARVHLPRSGTLLETLFDPNFRKRFTVRWTAVSFSGICRINRSSKFWAQPIIILSCR